MANSSIEAKIESTKAAAEAEARRVCVFCGASFGKDPAYLAAARLLGAELSRRGLELVWGGGSKGLMGAVAESVLETGGQCIGVIPEQLEAREWAFTRATKLHVVKSMHDRKAMMASLSAVCVAMPGGFGTFEEFFEILTWNQLGIHSKRLGILNVNGFYDGLLKFMDHASSEEFVRGSTHRDTVIIESDVVTLLDRILAVETTVEISSSSTPAGDERLTPSSIPVDATTTTADDFSPSPSNASAEAPPSTGDNSPATNDPSPGPSAPSEAFPAAAASPTVEPPATGDAPPPPSTAEVPPSSVFFVEVPPSSAGAEAPPPLAVVANPLTAEEASNSAGGDDAVESPVAIDAPAVDTSILVAA